MKNCPFFPVFKLADAFLQLLDKCFLFFLHVRLLVDLRLYFVWEEFLLYESSIVGDVHVKFIVTATSHAFPFTHGRTMIETIIIGSLNWNSREVAVSMAVFGKNCLFLHWLPYINVLLAFITCTNCHGIVELKYLSFKPCELKFGLETLYISVIKLALVFDIINALQVHLNQLNSFTQWFAYGDDTVPWFVQA